MLGLFVRARPSQARPYPFTLLGLWVGDPRWADRVGLWGKLWGKVGSKLESRAGKGLQGREEPKSGELVRLRGLVSAREGRWWGAGGCACIFKASCCRARAAHDWCARGTCGSNQNTMRFGSTAKVPAK